MLTPARTFTLFYVAQFLFLGVQLPFFPGWLYETGFSERSIGFVTGGSLILRLMLGPVVAYWAENRADQRLILIALTGLMFASAALMVAGFANWAVALLTIIMMWSFGCLVPLTDTAVMRADAAGILNYGRTRSVGSAAFIFANLVGGIVIARTGEAASVLWMAGAAGMAVLVATRLPASAQPASTQPAGAQPAGSQSTSSAAQAGHGDETAPAPLARPDLGRAVRLFRSRSFLLMLAAAGLTQGAHAVYYAFSKLHWSSLGYGSDLIGLLWTLGVAAEISILFFGRPLLKRFGPVPFLMAGALAAVIRWPLTGLSPPLALLVFLQLLHAFTFATAYLGAIEFISRAVPNNLANTAMTLVSTLGIGALTGAATIIAGLFFTAADPFPAYAMMGGMGLVGLVAALFLLRHWDGGIIRSERDRGAGQPPETETGSDFDKRGVPVPDQPR